MSSIFQKAFIMLRKILLLLAAVIPAVLILGLFAPKFIAQAKPGAHTMPNNPAFAQRLVSLHTPDGLRKPCSSPADPHWLNSGPAGAPCA